MYSFTWKMESSNPLWGILKYFSLFLFYVFDVFPARVSVHWVHAGISESQERALNSLEAGFQVVVSYHTVLGNESMSSGRAASAHNYRTVALTLSIILLKFTGAHWSRIYYPMFWMSWKITFIDAFLDLGTIAQCSEWAGRSPSLVPSLFSCVALRTRHPFYCVCSRACQMDTWHQTLPITEDVRR